MLDEHNGEDKVKLIDLKKYEDIRNDNGMNLPELRSIYSRKAIEFILTCKGYGLNINVVDPSILDLASNESERDLFKRTLIRFGVQLKGDQEIKSSRELVVVRVGKPIPEVTNPLHDYIILSDEDSGGTLTEDEISSIVQELSESPTYKNINEFEESKCLIRNNILSTPTESICFGCSSRQDCDVYLPSNLVFVNKIEDDWRNKVERDFQSYIKTLDYVDVTEDVDVLVSNNLIFKREIIDYNLYKTRLDKIINTEGTLLLTDKDSNFQKSDLINLATELILQHKRKVICSRRSLPNLLSSLYGNHPHIDLPIYEKIKVYKNLSKLGVKYESSVKSIFIYVLRREPVVRAISKRSFKFNSEEMEVKQDVDIKIDNIITPQEAGLEFSYDRNKQISNRDMLAPYFIDTVDLNNTLFTLEDGEVYIHTECTLNVEVTADLICYESNIKGIRTVSVDFSGIECDSLLPLNSINVDEDKVKELLKGYVEKEGKTISSMKVDISEVDLEEYKREVEKEWNNEKLRVIGARYDKTSVEDRLKNFEIITNLIFKKASEESRLKIINTLKTVSEFDFKKMYTTLGANKNYMIIRDSYMKSELSKINTLASREIYNNTSKKKLQDISTRAGFVIRYGTPYDKINPEHRKILDKELYNLNLEETAKLRAHKDSYLKLIVNMDAKVLDFYMPKHPIHLTQYLVAGDIEKFYDDAYSYLSMNLLRGNFKGHYMKVKNKRIFNSLLEMGEFGYPPLKRKALKDSNISSEKKELAKLHVCPR